MKAKASSETGTAPRNWLIFSAFCLFACSSDRDPAPPDPNAPKYYEDVAPLLAQNCVGCHRDGGIGRFPLTSYAEVRAHADEIATATATRAMPPMPVNNSGACNTFSNARWLSDDEIDLLGRWAKHGTLAGDASKAPKLPDPPASLTKVDATLDMGVSYTPDDSSGHDDYRCFVVPSPVDALRYIVAYEAIPGDPREVHHLIAYQPVNAAEASAAHALDDAADGDGYPCFGGPGVNASPVAMWAPGAGPIQMPAGTGVPLIAHRDLILQIHYNLENGRGPDRTTVGLAFATEPPISAQYWPIANEGLRLAPGREKVESTAHEDVQLDRFKLYGAGPHMHTLGRTLRVDLEADGESKCLVDVDRWDFHWQNFWWYTEPMQIENPSSISIRCGFDTRGKNDVVTWGENTSDEMCINYLYITTRDEPDSPPKCDDAKNPLFGSCLEELLAGCYEPDLSGTCSTDDGTTSWSDGSTIVTSGPNAGLYHAGSDEPCITLAGTAASVVLTKGDSKLSYTGVGNRVTIACPDGSTVEASGAQLTAFNLCHGVNCPN